MRVIRADIRPDPVADNSAHVVPDPNSAAVRRADGHPFHVDPAIDLGAPRLVGQFGAGVR
jgi:hypothetical protein